MHEEQRAKTIFWFGIAWMQFWLSVSIILWFWLEGCGR